MVGEVAGGCASDRASPHVRAHQWQRSAITSRHNRVLAYTLPNSWCDTALHGERRGAASTFFMNLAPFFHPFLRLRPKFPLLPCGWSRPGSAAPDAAAITD